MLKSKVSTFPGKTFTDGRQTLMLEVVYFMHAFHVDLHPH